MKERISFGAGHETFTFLSRPPRQDPIQIA